MTDKAGRQWEDPVLYGIVTGLLVVITVFLWQANGHLEEKILSDNVLQVAPVTPSASYLGAQMELSRMRYRQAAFAMYSKTVRRNAGFLVGAMMVLVGGVFVVRRIETVLDVEGQGREGASARIKTSSAGLAMAFFGTIILGITLLAKEPITVKDVGLQPDRGSAVGARKAETGAGARADALDQLRAIQEGNR